MGVNLIDPSTKVRLYSNRQLQYSIYTRKLQASIYLDARGPNELTWLFMVTADLTPRELLVLIADPDISKEWFPIIIITTIVGYSGNPSIHKDFKLEQW